MEKVKNKVIIVTGASGGLGAHIAWQIVKNGGFPVLVARSIDKLEHLANEIHDEFGKAVDYYCADLMESNEVEEVVTKIISRHPQIDGLINNAGTGKFQYAWEVDQEEAAAMFQLNVLSVMQMTQLFLPLFMKQGHGHIVIVASQAGKVATPKSSVYAATKHAVIGYANALRMELSGKGIYVTTVNPGPIKTNFLSVADPGGNYEKQVRHYILKPEQVAKKITRTLFKEKREINLPGWMEAGSRLYHLMPGLTEKILRNQLNKK